VLTRGRRLALVKILGLIVLCAQAAPGSAASGSHRIAIDRQGFWLGPLVWNAQTSNRAVSLGDFIRAFGRESSCVVGKSRTNGRVTWQSRGVRGNFTTLGGLPHPSDTPCTAPAHVQPDTVEVFDAVWRTGRGLHVGDTVVWMSALYPRATLHKDGWWLVTRTNDPLWGTYGQLVAGIRNGRITYLRLVLHAEGD
jgi:hypothetical protein